VLNSINNPTVILKTRLTRPEKFMKIRLK